MMVSTATLLAMGMMFGAPPAAKAAPAAETARVDKAAREALAQLPGEKAFAFTEVTPAGPKLLYGLRENDRFAIGSGFKLFILGTLTQQVNDEQRRLADVKTLQADWIGPPHSEMAGWPMGSPVTLHTFALKMISISDNTATDHLIHLLGRETIEAQMVKMGHRQPEWNIPLLETREMTMLRDRAQGMPGKKYQTLDLAGKRQFLTQWDAMRPDYDKLDFDTTAYNLAEWFATPLDMARALTWIKLHTEADQPAAPVRAILTVDPKLQYDPAVWTYVGFKGGSEDQLLAGNWLLQHRNGRWYTFHANCNNPDGKLDMGKMITAVQELFAVMQDTLE
ncbi:serine hydrolase [Lignipirellula cremea]|uniref:Beta-lactamase class A catalytic domain-containing protein n=1 Tax=Lignipirellula cremea TaxID=2528010 RepID=A0A518DPH8_9BACT|nr:serine hydrolase [Lignipirellula cremea]QDU93734.1 hypothetical protein Pla8534_15170 [Lignipirellula cremea]